MVMSTEYTLEEDAKGKKHVRSKEGTLVIRRLFQDIQPRLFLAI